MPYVTVPKDVTKVKNKIAFGLTKRQIISFAIAVVVGLPVFWLLKTMLTYDIAFFGMCLIVMPILFAGFMQKDGMPLEKYIMLVIRANFILPKTRYYQTENAYEKLAKSIELKKEYQRYVTINQAKKSAAHTKNRPQKRTDKAAAKGHC